ncbi:MAG TPA: GrpB family protein [Methanocella sp.]|jgi:GrpB-like predicted nucleotidyltransferase (UPF0157 family)
MADQWKSITTVRVLPHDPAWKDEYHREAQKLREILDDEISEIHHIGSTSVPGLPAKPVIDILIGVRKIEDIDRYNDAMVRAGYEARGEYGIPGRRFFTKGIPERTHNVHIFQADDPGFKRHLNFRDYLIAHQDSAQKYGELKKALAGTCENDLDRYCDGKDAFVKETEKKAIEWAKNR